MRKKSHISLAGYLVKKMNVEELRKHRKAFYLGSILPDLTPKMITSPHEFGTSYEELKDRICSLVTDAEAGDCAERVIWRKLGVVMHYVADYFTFPHNSTYDGSLKDHCFYERDMKYELRAYIQTDEAEQIFSFQMNRSVQVRTLPELFQYIEKAHGSYLGHRHSVADDCRWIVELCSRVLIGLTNILVESTGVQSDRRVAACF